MAKATGPSQYDVVIFAGYTPASAAAEYLDTGGGPKALLSIAGRPMLSYIVDALRDSSCMRRLVLVGLSADEIPDLGLDVPLTLLPNRPSIADNALAALDELGDAEYALFCAADVPLLTPTAVRDFVERCEASGADVCYSMVRREAMEERFPGAGRTCARLVEGEFVGGDIHLIRLEVMHANADFLRTVTDRRKNHWGLIRTMGLGIILRFLTHRLHIEDLKKRVHQVLGCSCEGIISPYPELAMDVDKPRDLRMVLEIMGQGQA